MAIQQRGNSFRAKVFDGKALIASGTFGSHAEAAQFILVEKANRLAPPSTIKRLSDGIRLSQAKAAARSREGLRRFDRRQEGYVHVSTLPHAPRAPAVEGDDLPLSHYVKLFIEKQLPKRKGKVQDAYTLNYFLTLPICRKLARSELSRADFQKFRDDRRKQVSAATVNKQLNLWSSIIDIARDEWNLDIPENPASIRRAEGGDNARDRRLDKETNEEARLLAAVVHDPILHDAAVIAIDTAMRQGEILACAPSWLKGMTGAQSFVVIPKEAAKTAKSRNMPILTQRTHDVLERRAKAFKGKPLFAIAKNAFAMRWRRALKNAGIEDLTFHDLRHEAISRIYELKLYQQAEIMRMVGHDSHSAHKRYLQSDPSELAKRARGVAAK
jgi:integrase